MRDALATTIRRLTAYAVEAAGLAALGAKDVRPGGRWEFDQEALIELLENCTLEFKPGSSLSNPGRLRWNGITCSAPRGVQRAWLVWKQRREQRKRGKLTIRGMKQLREKWYVSLRGDNK